LKPVNVCGPMASADAGIAMAATNRPANTAFQARFKTDSFQTLNKDVRISLNSLLLQAERPGKRPGQAHFPLHAPFAR